MARGLLVSFAGYPVMISSFFPDNGLASLAGTLLAHGHEVKVLDFNTSDSLVGLVPAERSRQLEELMPLLSGPTDREAQTLFYEIDEALDADLILFAREMADRLTAEVEAQKSDFIGFKLWSGDGFVASVRAAEMLKHRFPAIRVYGGGPAVLYSEETIFEYTGAFDALVDGEGEEAIIGLAESISGSRDLADVPNLILRDGASIRRTARSFVVDLDELALPSYSPEVYPSLRGDRQIKLFVIDESRGCPMGCAFCTHRNATGRRWRTKSSRRFLNEAESLNRDFGCSQIRLGGSYTPMSFFEGIIDCVGRNGTSFHFSGFAHPDGIPLDRVEDMATAGCRSLFFGVESFVPADQEMLGKRIEPQHAVNAIRKCQEAGIVPGIAMIVPLPGQSPSAREKNLSNLLELAAAGAALVMVTIPGLLPRTPWFQERSRYGFKLNVAEDEYRSLLSQYKIRHVLPPAMWEPLPYELDGNRFQQICGICASFQSELTKEGILTNIPDELVLVAESRGESLGACREWHREMLLKMDACRWSGLIADTNRSLEAS
ncbi:MAG: radical SAM protein [Deltaproteobacteria bacterium]|nr:radical SAM protein [Deltaproteobacteria bacterium]